MAEHEQDKEERKWVYCFAVWPEHGWQFHTAVFEVFKMHRLIEFEFTEKEFNDFRSGLSHHGLGLREVSRVPHHVPEVVL